MNQINRVLHIGPNSPHLFNYLQAFEKVYGQVYCVTDEKNEANKRFILDVVNFKSSNPSVIFNQYKQFKSCVQQFNPSVIHIHQVNRMGFWVARVAKKLNIPIIVTAWGSDVLLMPQQNKLYRYLVKSTLSKAKIITADAQLMIDAMKKMVPNRKYVWLQYGIDPIEGKQKENIIYSNRLHKPLYRIDKIVDLFAEFNKANPDWVLKIAATGSETELLKQKVTNYGLDSKVQFLGWLSNEENRKHYETAKIYMSIPVSDGTSVSLLEAMSAGCIPVVSDLPANREWIENKINGVIWNEQSNPIDNAIRLNHERVEAINTDMILSKATRSASLNHFVELYNELTADNS